MSGGLCWDPPILGNYHTGITEGIAGPNSGFLCGYNNTSNPELFLFDFEKHVKRCRPKRGSGYRVDGSTESTVLGLW